MTRLIPRTMHTVAALIAATVALGQWHFRLDTTFRTNISEKNVNHMRFLEDGRIFLSGRVRYPGEFFDRGGSCLLPNGQLDPTFPPFPQTTGGHRIMPWVDGYYYVGTGLVRRLGPNGLVDPTFINNLNSGPYFSNHFNGDYHTYPDGRILLTGDHNLNDPVRGFVGRYNLIWFSNEGYIDTTRIHRKGNNCWVGHIQELPPGPYQGGFICTSTCTQFEGHAVDWIFRTDSLGIPDTTFRTGVFHGEALTFLPLPDGRVYAGGIVRRQQAPQDTLRLARFMTDGSLDPTFSIPHFATGGGLTAPDGPYVYRAMPWPDGNLLVTGNFKYVNGEPRHGLCMIDSTGQLLPAFAGNWMGNYVEGSITYSVIVDVLPNADTTALYICGAFIGYGDGEITDPDQRFVSRLLVEKDNHTLVQEAPPPKPPALRLYPNPCLQQAGPCTHVTVELAPLYNGVTTQGTLVLRDALGREVLRQRVAGRVNMVPLHGLGSGVYLLEHWEAGERRGTNRLVIQP